MKANIILFNKPSHCLSQFTDNEGRDTLANYIDAKNFYAAGRLDYDSEGLIVLTNNGKLQAYITSPLSQKKKTYLAQVEGSISKAAVNELQRGVLLKDGLTLPAQVKKISSPKLWRRNPPIRFRKNGVESWVKITIVEGKNRQVRRMLSHVDFPCLRLVRISVDNWHLNNLQPGEVQRVLLS